ncbi:MAG: HAMP domain-containing histidine kinase [Thermoleophilia bacterium]|nr:HAMP domain-containing histidine kinase [Thermoleophilia bacterium]
MSGVENASGLVSTVAHELQAPLAAIRGAIGALRDPAAGLGGEARERLFRVIADGADQLQGLVDDLLVAGRLGAGRLPLEIGPCDAAVIARDVVEAAGAHLRPGVRLSLDAPAPLPAVAADPERLRQVLANLVSNATKHAAAGVRVSLAGAGDRVRVSVADDGPGVPAEARERIFEPFERLPGAPPGTGLGLHLARGLAAAMGATLTLDDAPGPGAAFTLDLPAA